MRNCIASKSNRVIKAGIGYTVGNYLLKGINFLTVPLFTRIMSTADYGTYSIYMTYDGIISVFIALALHSTLKNAKYEYKERFNEYLSSILIIPLIVLSSLLVIVNLFSGSFQNLLDLNRIVLNILLCHSFANAIIMIYNGKVSLSYRYQDFLKISLVNTLTNLVLSLILMYTLFINERYMGRIIGSALPMVCIAIFIYASSFRKEKPRYNKAFWRFAVSYSLPIIPHGLSQIILSSFDRVMIKSMVGVSQAGIYSLGVNIEELVKVTTTSLDTVWGPWFYEKMAAGDHESIKKFSTYYAYGMFVLLGCLMIAGPEIILIMGSATYQDAKYVVIPLLCCTYFTFLYTIPSAIEYYYKKTHMIALGTMGAAVLNIVLNYFAISSYGYQAAAYTTLISYAAYFVFHYNIAKRIAGKQMFNTNAILGFVAGILLINVFSIWLVEYFWIRLIVGCSFLLINLFIAWKIIYPQVKAISKKGQAQ